MNDWFYSWLFGWMLLWDGLVRVVTFNLIRPTVASSVMFRVFLSSLPSKPEYHWYDYPPSTEEASPDATPENPDTSGAEDAKGV